MNRWVWVIIAAVVMQSCNAPSQEGEAANPSDDQVPVALPPDHWHAFFSPDIPYYNVTQAPVTARAAPELASPPVGSIAPGGGGYIAACDEAGAWCALPLNGQGDTGWVLMKDFGGSAL